jgi:hypothetical protein
MGEIVKSDVKKPYSPPVLTVHGTVRELTQANSPMGTADGGMGGGNPLNNKTAVE